jgi:hypothetical protein
MAAIFAFHMGKAIVQISTVQIPVDDLLDIRTEKSIESFKTFLIDLEKGFKMILHTPVIIGRLRIPCTIDGGREGHELSPSRISCRHNVEQAIEG